MTGWQEQVLKQGGHKHARNKHASHPFGPRGQVGGTGERLEEPPEPRAGPTLRKGGREEGRGAAPVEALQATVWF